MPGGTENTVCFDIELIRLLIFHLQNRLPTVTLGFTV